MIHRYRFISEHAAVYGVARLCRVLRHVGLPRWHEVKRPRRDSLIDPYTSYLHQRWNDGCTDTATLYAEIRERGYRGSVQTLRRYLQPRQPIEGTMRRRLPAPSTPAPPKPHRATKWIMSDPAKLKADDQHKLDAIRQRSRALDALTGHIQDFAGMMHKLRATRLPPCRGAPEP